jgi:glycosyltransferase involved in cell wall biosynthesis
MPTWQGEEFLERVLAALAAQRVDVPWDFLRVDSGSTDRTLAILDEWKRARLPRAARVDADPHQKRLRPRRHAQPARGASRAICSCS